MEVSMGKEWKKWQAVRDKKDENDYKFRKARRDQRSKYFTMADLINDYGNIDKSVELSKFLISGTANKEAIKLLNTLRVVNAEQVLFFEKVGSKWEAVLSDKRYFARDELTKAYKKCRKTFIREKMRRLFDKRDYLFNMKKVTLYDYQNNTEATFISINNLTPGGEWKRNEEQFKHDKYASIEKLRRKFLKKDASYVSDSGSAYWVIKNRKGKIAIVRRANHWGTVAGCNWWLDTPNLHHSSQATAFCMLEDFKRNQ